MFGKNKSKNVKIIAIALASFVVVLSAALLIGASISHAKKKEQENRAEVSLNQKDLIVSTQPATQPIEKTVVEILLEETAVPVGTSFKAAAIVTPADTDKALVWNSSNMSVFTVDSEGVVTVHGTGTAVLTATVGDVSDAVAIEGISSVTSGSVNHYPVYTGGFVSAAGQDSEPGGDTGNNQEGGNSGNGSLGNNQEGGNAGSGNIGDHQEGGNAGNGNIGDNQGGGNAGDGNISDNQGSGNSGDGSIGDHQGGGNSGDGNIGDNQGSGSSGGGNSGDNQGSGNAGSGSADFTDVLSEQGFAQSMSNVYVCNENNTYYGEIITQPNVTIIYIKQRNSTFDSRIRAVLQSLLPTEYNQVWNNYLSAATDRTFTVEGRKVRLVTAYRGGHSQIVIYN